MGLCYAEPACFLAQCCVPEMPIKQNQAVDGWMDGFAVLVTLIRTLLFHFRINSPVASALLQSPVP